MKKRSLVSAIAMLVVSAIVLTSATFAWFATGDNASVTAIEAEVSNAGGAILISADQTEWVTTLEKADFVGGANNTLPATLKPVSIDPTNNNMTYKSGSIDSGKYKPATDSEEKIVTFSVWVKSDADCQVKVTSVPVLGKSFIYAAVAVDNVVTKVAGDSTGYTPYIDDKEVEDNGAGTNAGNNVIDADEATAAGASLGNELTAEKISANLTLEGDDALELTANTPVKLTYYLWAEGQHTACSGQVPAATSSIAIDFAKV